MSTGGINSTRPLPNLGTTSASPLAPAAEPANSYVAAAPPAAAFVAPVAGANAGNVQAAGGLVEDGLPRTAAIAAGVAGQALAGNQELQAAQQAVANQQVVDPAEYQGSNGIANAAATHGPAAWNDGWAQKFRDLGAPAEVLQQLIFTGAMGADEAQLSEMYTTLETEIKPQLAKFATDHPKEFKKLAASKQVDRGMLVQIASAVNAGQVPDEQLKQMVDSLGASAGLMMFKQFVLPMLPYSLVPGWGAVHLLLAPFTGGKDPFTGEKMGLDPLTVLTALGGAFTLFNVGKGALQAYQGAKLIGKGGDALAMARNSGLVAEGATGLAGWTKVKSFIPGTKAASELAGIGRLTDLNAGIEKLSGIAARTDIEDLALDSLKNVKAKAIAGEIALFGEAASKLNKWGFQPHARGVIINRSKALTSMGVLRNMPALQMDVRLTGGYVPAFVAAEGLNHASSGVAAKIAKVAGVAEGSVIDATTLAKVQEQVLAHTTEALTKTGLIKQYGGLAKIMGIVRPGAAQDAQWAIANTGSGGTELAKHGWAALGKPLKFGILGVAAATAGYFFMIKPPKDAAKKAAAEQEKAAAEAAAQQQPGAGGGPLTAEQTASLQKFAALPAEQRTQMLQNQYAQLQQLEAQGNLTQEQKATLDASYQELELFAQVDAQVSGTTTGGDAATATAPAAGAQPAAAPTTFTPQGLGLA